MGTKGKSDVMDKIENIPEEVFLIHGEPSSLDVFRVKLKDTFNWKVSIPKLYDSKEFIV